ncbi:MAG: 3-dehydroquinate synthase [Hyphomicrobiales bacterium]
MTRVRIPGSPVRYPVHAAPGLIRRAGALARPFAAGGRVALVSDRTVDRLYGARVARSLGGAGLRVDRYTFPPGERSKSLETARRLIERWARDGHGKDTLVVALGGGVVSDVTGFAAAIYGRGVPWVVFPTTLLSQADASIGGKTGVNLPAAKNLVGAFHHPRAVFADPSALATLSTRAFRSGLAEVAKMGFVRRPALLRPLRALARAGRPKPGADVAAIVRACAAAKAWYVTQDERDRGIRRELNFGHTVGHALEASSGYGRYLHGEAVSIGMAAELRLSVLEAGLDPVDAQDAEALLRDLGLPVRLPRMPGEAFWQALLRDKKRGRKGARVVLCPAIGVAEVHTLSSLTGLRRVLLSLVERPR